MSSDHLSLSESSRLYRRARKSTSSLVNVYEEDFAIRSHENSSPSSSRSSSDKRNKPSIPRQHDLEDGPVDITAIRADCATADTEGLRHGKLSFEDHEVNVGAHVTARRSALALAVDSLFHGSSEYSERAPLEGEGSQSSTGLNIFKSDPVPPEHSQVLAREHGFAPLTRTVFFQGSSEYSARGRPASVSSRYRGLYPSTTNDATAVAQAAPAIPRSMIKRLEESTPRRHPSDGSVHLQHMRISQHLRSFSSLSEDSAFADAFASEALGHAKTAQKSRGVMHRRSNSSFQSVQVPESWGIVTPQLATEGSTMPDKQASNAAHVGSPGQGTTRDASIDSVADPRKGTLKLDGLADSYDDQPDASVSMAPPTPSSGRSIGSNYDDTASMWERAFAAHQDQQQEASRKRGSSFSSVARRASKKGKLSSEASRVPSVAIVEPQVSPEDQETKPFVLKRVNTSFSFDHLQIPNRASISRSGSPGPSDQQVRRASDRLSPDGRVRSVSSPAAHEQATFQEREFTGPLLVVPGATPAKLSVPSVTLSEPIQDSVSVLPPLIPGPFDHLDPAERPWARYPSHTRETRNGPASEATGDEVKVVDYQPLTEPATASEGSSDRQKRRDKIKFRAMTVVLKRKILTDLPAAFKSQDGTYRRRQHGHRSSISAGGKTEYPELELMPATAPRLPSAIDADAVYGPSLARQIERRSLERRPTMSGGSGSNYGLIEARSPMQSESGSVKRTASLLASGYQQHISGRGRLNSEAVSPLDGMVENQSLSNLESPGSRSLPSRSMKPVVQGDVIALIRFNSHQELRSSTYDLLERFKADETKSRHSALIAAEGDWLD